MLRSVIGVIVGYVVMFVLVAGAFSVLYLFLGAEGAYQEDGSWEVSPIWSAMAVVIGIVAAIGGGIVCRLISKRRGAVMALAVVVLVLGGLSAVFALQTEAPTEPRPADISFGDAASQSRQPAWLLVANPLIGAIGVLIGGGVVPSRGPRASAAPGDRTEV